MLPGDWLTRVSRVTAYATTFPTPALILYADNKTNQKHRPASYPTSRIASTLREDQEDREIEARASVDHLTRMENGKASNQTKDVALAPFERMTHCVFHSACYDVSVPSSQQISHANRTHSPISPPAIAVKSLPKHTTCCDLPLPPALGSHTIRSPSP
ncbi:hypothetical protein BU26DRAFT_351858 [Trematosphaeria pertusa]|uniref:Uncharacterized protein n=1 Tax=Trematosphaeria pertusa TaxID=390896 RepID=A0A6A6IAT9_9PLEO|nr:uncharacterized protein BU26DRAFT_351858 [Trematosphaeria pertusa]KAF2247685.1 hypothetical protein BU26DRAFT_351858 [Trematosphaeria pertusa]